VTKLKRIANKLDDPSEALHFIGGLMVEQYSDNFRDEGAAGSDWQERAVPNLFGIISDFTKAAGAPKKRRFSTTKTLQDTGRLAGSATYDLLGKRGVQGGSNEPYAIKHHRGEESESLPITRTVQERAKKWLARAGKKWKDDLWVLTSPEWLNERVVIDLPERPLLVINQEFINDVIDFIQTDILGADQ
jgi:phage gpG-like protein